MSWFAITILSSSILVAIVSADKRDILVNTARESWLSAENLRTLLRVSFSVSDCCNVQISGQSAGTKNIFNQFVKIYPFKYLVNERTYDCNSYLMISESANNIVTDVQNAPTEISNTEFLIILDDNAKNSPKLFNTSMYGYSSVNIAALDGLWRLSENFVKPRVFEKHFRHREMVRSQGIVSLEGRELQGATRFQPPVCYLQTAVNKTVNGIKAEVFVPKNESEIDGVELKLFMLLAEGLNFTWTMRQPNERSKYGAANKTRWSGGLIGLLFDKQVDIAFGTTGLVEDIYHFSNLSTPWSTIDLAFLVPRPKSHLSVWALIEPLSPRVWIAVFVALIVQSAHVYIGSWISPRIDSRFQSLTATLTELLGRLLGTWAPKNMQGLKTQFQLWHLMGILIITAYSSSLAARLTNPKYDARIDSTRDFVKANLTWGRRDVTINASKLFNQNDRYVSQIYQRHQQESSESQRHERIMRGDYAIFGFRFDSIYFPEESIRREDLKQLRAMKDSMFRYYLTFAVQPWLLEPVNKVLFCLIEAGLVDYLMHDVLHRRTSSELREVLIEHDGQVETPRVLQLIPLAVAFSVLISGIIISSVVFSFELYTASRKKPLRELLLEIRRKRTKKNRVLRL